MPIIITIDEVKVKQITIDVAQQRVQVVYVLLAEGVEISRGELFAYKQLPEFRDMDGKVIPKPDNYYQLPTDKATEFASLVGWIQTQLNNKIL